jgi:hypothetical protein
MPPVAGSDVWSDAQVIAALRECVRLLGPIAAEVEISEPVKREQCGAPAPVSVRRIGSGGNQVDFSPPALVNCAMVVGLHSWVEKTLQPAAQEMLGSRITRLENASGYVCRNRIGSHSHSDRLSEHALANAIDIAGFVTADGRTIEVARSWGLTVRDQEAQRLAAHKKPEAPHEGPQRHPHVRAIADAAEGSNETPRSTQTAELQKPAKGASDARADPKEDVANSVQARFLRRLHRGACGVFSTVLGPEANEAHRNHFHFDLVSRRHSAFCQ